MKKIILAMLLSLLMITSIVAQQLTDGFEIWPSENWNLIETEPETNTISQSANFANTGTYSLQFSSYDPADSYDQYMVSNEINWTDPANEFSFYHRKYTYGSESIAVGWSTTGNDVATDFTWSTTITPTETWTQYLKTDLPAETKYVAIHYFSDYQYYCYIDDVVLGNPPAGTPDAPILTSPADLAGDVAIDVDLTWTTGDFTDHVALYLENSTDFTATAPIDPATSPYTTSLEYATTYYWKVVAISEGELEAESLVRSFTTMIDPATPATPILVSPTNNTHNVALAPILEWEIDANTTEVDVYFSNVAADVTNMEASALVVDGQNVTSYQAPELDPLTIYYWRVIAHNTPNELVANGPVWQFDTEYGDGFLGISIGNGTTSSYQYPWNFYYGNSVAETIYLAEELDISGEILGISYYNTFVTDLSAMPVSIWIGETTQTDLTSYIPASQLTVAFEGTVDFPAGQNLINITFDRPYDYAGGNLVLLTERPLGSYYDFNDRFYNTVTDLPNRTLSWQSDTVDLDPETVTGGSASASMPNTSFYFTDAGRGSVAGTVSDGRTGLAGVNVTIDGTYHQTFTAEDGTYEFPHVAVNDAYTLTASLAGYVDASTRFSVTEGVETEVNLTMTELPTAEVTGQIVANDTGLGLQAHVSLTGYDNYEVDTDANGYFTFAEVYQGHTYTGSAIAEGYHSTNFQAVVADVDLDLGTITVNEYLFPTYNVLATLDGNDAVITWGEAATSLEEGWITKGGEDNNDGIGVNAEAIIDASQMYTEAELADYQGMYINSIKFFPREATATYTLKVWGGADGNIELYSQAVTEFTNGVWNEYALDSSVAIPTSGPIYIGYTADTPTGHPCGCDIGPAVTGGDMIKLNNQPLWDSMYAAYGLNYNWNLQAYVSNLPRSRVASGSRKVVSRNNPNEETRQLVRGNLTAIPNVYTSRAFEAYNVYRFLKADEANPENWILVGEEIDGLTYRDEDWSNLDPDYYEYAVKAVYTNDNEANASLSNWLQKTSFVDVTFNVASHGGNLVANANLTLVAQTPNPDGQYQQYAGITDALGSAVITANVGMYDISVTADGFNDYSGQCEATDGAIIDITLYEMVDVTVNVTSNTGDILANANISLIAQEANNSGTYYQYNGTTDATGLAVIAVNTGMYNLSATKLGFISYSAEIDASAAITANIVLDEVAYPVTNVLASIEGDNAVVTWDVQSSDVEDSIQEGFEEAFPPAGWTTVVNNTTQSWAQYETVSFTDSDVVPTEGVYQAGLSFDYGAQDEWLITNAMNCPAGNLTFDFYGHYGSTNGDNYYVKVSTDGINWTPLWNASALPEGDNHYDAPVSINLDMYYGQNIQLAWNFVDGDGYGLWYSTFIDNINIGGTRIRANQLTSVSKAVKSTNISTSNMRNKKDPNEPVYQPIAGLNNTRAFEAYNVYRFLTEDETTMENWILVDEATNQLSYTDLEWANLTAGIYKYAVEAVYTYDNLSRAVKSNLLYKDMLGNVEGYVMSEAGNPIANAYVYLGDFEAITDANGYYLFTDILIGGYDITAYATGYESALRTVMVVANQTADVSFILGFIFDCPNPSNINIVVTGNNANLSWDPVTVNNNDQAVSNVLYVVYSGAIPHNADEYYFLAETLSTSYEDTDIGVENPKQFYIVKAYGGDVSEILSILNNLQSQKRKISLRDVENLIKRGNTKENLLKRK